MSDGDIFDKVTTGRKYSSKSENCLSLSRNGNLITDPVITANLFNTHFCNIHQTVAVDKSITYTSSDSHINTLKTNLLTIEKFNILVTVKFVESQLKHWTPPNPLE